MWRQHCPNKSLLISEQNIGQIVKSVPQILITQFDYVKAVVGVSHYVVIWSNAHTSVYVIV